MGRQRTTFELEEVSEHMPRKRERQRERVDKKGKKDDPVALKQFLIL